MRFQILQQVVEHISVNVHALRKGLQDELAIAEWMGLAAYNLKCFVPFAGDEHDIASARTLGCVANRLTAILNPQHLARAFHALLYIFADGTVALASRVVAGNDHMVRQALSDGAHEGAFGFVAVAAAAEQAPQCCLRKAVTRRDQCLLQCIGVWA